MFLKRLLIFMLFSIIGCNSQNKTTMPKYKYTNDLIRETSPYLLQHAHNPVNWHAWNDETLALAKKENKMLLISIGYAACHWCHVMEHESFENVEVAKLMNDNFICIKVDREERPDVDQVYMDAVQLLTGRGGWPLNAIALPDGSPFWGGTYFPKEKWVAALTQIADLWKEDPAQIEEYAEELTKGVRDKNILSLSNQKEDFDVEDVAEIVTKWQLYFDTDMGGLNRAPKFPMPNNYHFLLRYAVQSDDKELMEYVNTTLIKMAYGGMYDQVGGGFARYATDIKWHVPHFEKMLYDNGQLVSLYADAYLISKNPLYKEVVYETLDFVEREMTDETGAFYSSLDADSNTDKGELEEGAYYIWTAKELQDLLGDDYTLFKQYYNINEYGLWEDDNYVLIRDKSDIEISLSNKIDVDVLSNKVKQWKKLLLNERSKRNKPRLDDKILTSWNALMIKAYVDAYRVFDDEKFLRTAEKAMHFYRTKMLREDGGLYRNYKEGKYSINAYLKDYAFMIDALISLYEVTFNEKYLQQANVFTEYSIQHFWDKDSQFFYFTSDLDKALITRKKELADNVIPASNSMMALNLFKLSHYFDKVDYKKKSEKMLTQIYPQIKQYPPSYSNWLQLMSNTVGNYYEIAISGKEALSRLKEFNTYYIPNKLMAGAEKESDIPLLQNRYNVNKTSIYICVNNACQLPIEKVYKAKEQIKIKF